MSKHSANKVALQIKDYTECQREITGCWQVHPEINECCKTFKLLIKPIIFFKENKTKNVRYPGFEPGSIAWKATILTARLISLTCYPTCFKL